MNSDLEQGSRSQLPVSGTRLTAIVSVTMVLLLLGVVGLMAVGVAGAVKQVRESMGFVAIMSEDATPAEINSLHRTLAAAPFTQKVTYTSADDVMDRWQEMLGEEEDIEALLDSVNPFTSEMEVKVREAYSTPDSLASIAGMVEAQPGVEKVRISADVIEKVNRTATRLMLLFGAVALLLLVISVVLINNTVRLTIFSRRFTIKTMQLVGATGSFIRRPIVGQNVLSGLLAGVVAGGLLVGAYFYARSVGALPGGILTVTQMAIVACALPVAGMLLCGLTAAPAVNKYLRRKHDQV